MIFAIVVACGSGLRFKSKNNLGLPKQYHKIKDDLIISFSVKSLLNHNLVRKVVIVVRQCDFEFAENIFCNEIENERIYLTIGGRDRLDSAMNGLNFIKENFGVNFFKFVMIHDAVRPVLSQELIGNLIDKISSDDELDGVLPILKIAEALKKIENNKVISVDRSNHFTAQTPQIFRFNKIIECAENHYDANNDNSQFHDEVDFLQKNGYKIGFVDGCKKNLKITTEDDLRLANYLIDEIT